LVCHLLTKGFDVGRVIGLVGNPYARYWESRPTAPSQLTAALIGIALPGCADHPIPPPCKIVVSAPQLDSPDALPTLGSIPAFSLNSTDSSAPTLGTVVINAYVDDKGNLTSYPEIAGSSGNPKLDTAAMKIAGRLHYTPPICDGKAVFGCVQYRITFFSGPSIQS